MIFYKISGSGPSTYVGTLVLARKTAKGILDTFPETRESIRVEEVQIKTDKAHMVTILNRDFDELVVQTWAITPRKGLIAVNNGE